MFQSKVGELSTLFFFHSKVGELSALFFFQSKVGELSALVEQLQKELMEARQALAGAFLKLILSTDELKQAFCELNFFLMEARQALAGKFSSQNACFSSVSR